MTETLEKLKALAKERDMALRQRRAVDEVTPEEAVQRVLQVLERTAKDEGKVPTIDGGICVTFLTCERHSIPDESLPAINKLLKPHGLKARIFMNRTLFVRRRWFA